MSSGEGKSDSPFTTRDLELFGYCMRSLKSEFAVDYQKLADLAGYKNANSSKAAFHGLKKKLDKLGVGPVGTNGPSLSAGGDEKATPASGKKRKTPTKRDDEEEAGEEGTPAKKKGRKPRAAPKSKASTAGGDAEEDDVETAVVKGEEGEDEAAGVKSEPDEA
ncbi:Hypothetical predicted protein [Lecanosticta acicola]|uniref:Uncharacterized protein n=1 Tax=Lecanosticta acicola TaxID=111012 RepID=A0AAI8Z4P1_9PEZI|nr:Hypothetical predicted protein [Lecanosticta acicola]